MYTELPSPDLLSAGRFDEKPGFTVYRERGARNWMLSLTISGTADFRVGDSVTVAGPGDLVLIAPGTVQHYASSDDGIWGYWWAHFQPRPAWYAWWRIPQLAPGFSLTRFGTRDRFGQAVGAFERVHRYAMVATLDTPQGRVPVGAREVSGALASELALNAIEELLLLAVVEHELQQRPALDSRVQQVLDTIAADLSRPMSVDALARIVSLSPSRLAHLFRQEIGDSIVNVALAMRLRKAASLLEFTDRPIGRIATDIGFSSPYYFSRQFRERFGVSPSAFRQQARHPG
ncbi:helix-turn-helix domain-containing protein [Rugosimonospora africana]|uniref:helix-turn-helix domain-containing protein n=1 Tax=Rugosimonospora africana TaxID=556532 RepID=UPI001942204E|nr:helix-turn-helix domain-containing protein [Rugosimonospora africana]